MSNTNSQFQVLAGRRPKGNSAMEGNFPQKAVPTATLTEGMFAAVENAGGVAVIDALTSGNMGAVPDYPWLVIQGMDQSDTAFVDNVTCLATTSGLVCKIDTTASFDVGDLVYSNAGVVTKVDASQQAIGQVIEANATADYIVVAT